jgi:hypothetical protein
MSMNLGQLQRLGFIEMKGDMIHEGPLLDLMMNTDMLKDRIINGTLADIFRREPLPGSSGSSNDADILAFPSAEAAAEQE